MHGLTSHLPAALAAVLALSTFAPQDPQARAPNSDRVLTPLLQQSQAAWNGQRYLATVDALAAARDLAAERFVAAVRAALPTPQPDYLLDEPPAAPSGAASLTPLLGTATLMPVESRYRGPDGHSVLRVVFAPRSSQVRATRIAIVAADEREDTEVVEVDTFAVLVQRGRTMTRIATVIGDEHLLEVQAIGTPEEDALALFTPESLQRLSQIAH
ncbi:MAG: hypothetical protein IPM29_32465 [Planctomycetes bacterium]|nr:hypothetical protein [Planctomycetota bacterium]